MRRQAASVAAVAVLAGCRAPPSAVVELSEADFEERTSRGVVLVDVWAPKCPPCTALAPVVEEIAGEFAERALVCKLNRNEAPSVAEKLGIKGVPTLIIFRDGEEVSRMLGLRRREELTAELEKALGR